MYIKIKKLFSRIPLAGRASIALFAANIASKGITYLTTPIFSNILTSDEYGKVLLFYSWYEIIGIIATCRLSYGVYTVGLVDYKDKRDSYSFSMLALGSIICIGVSSTVLLFYRFIGKIIKLDTHFMVLMLITCLVQPAYAFWVTRQRFELKYKLSSLWAVIVAFIPVITSVIAVLICQDRRLEARLYGAQVVCIVIYLFFYILLANKARWHVDTSYWKNALKFNIPLLPHYLSLYLLNSSDKIMISWLVNDSATAYYGVAYSVAAIATTVWSSINPSLVPTIYEKCETKDYKGLSRIVNSLLFVFFFSCVLIMLLGPEIVSIMAPNEYLEAMIVIPPVIAGVFFQIQYYLYSTPLFYYKKTYYVSFASVLATILNLFLNYYFISKYGYVAAGYTTLACYLVQAIINYLAMKKVLKESPYNMKIILLFSVAVLFTSLFVSIIYSYYVIRYILVSLIVIMAIINREKIMKIIMGTRNNKKGDCYHESTNS